MLNRYMDAHIISSITKYVIQFCCSFMITFLLTWDISVYLLTNCNEEGAKIWEIALDLRLPCNRQFMII